MKKQLLLSASLIFMTGVSLGQFTESNEPAINDITTLYIIDSSAVDYETSTGADVTWNYSMYGGYNGESRSITVVDPTSTPETGTYPLAETALGIEDFLLTYNSSTAGDRTSHGFVFNEPSFGEIIVRLDVDPALHYEYPMGVGDQVTDIFEGNMDFELSGIPQSLPIDGDHIATVDGSGTLELANGVTLSNVIRYKISEKINIDNAPVVGDLVLIRVQYEYYQQGTSNLPVLIHSSGILKSKSNGNVLFDYTLVMSSEEPAETADLTVQEIKEAKVYPNPASEKITIELPQGANEVQLVVLDNLGKIVIEETMNSEEKELNVSKLEQGLYFVQIISGDIKETKKVIVK